MKLKDESKSERRANQLGMSYGTASGRLRKMILFDVLRKHSENKCFKCGELIESEKDLSIEHKQPWENKNPDLFWDLNNIAFSHMCCNIPHVYKGSGASLRKIGPEGTSWCWQHKEFLPIGEFYTDSSNWNGLHSRCKSCHKSRPR
jgi:hypothetical protein